MANYAMDAPVEKQVDIFDQYKQAKNAFDAACHQYQQATVMRAESEKRLQDLSQQLARVLNDGMADPTMPQPGQAPVMDMQSSVASLRRY